MTAGGTAVIIGVGPGLGMSVARRFGREGYDVALISRSDARHASYVASLSESGVRAEAFVADVADRARLLSIVDTVAERLGRIDAVYYGPGAADPSARPGPVTGTTVAEVERLMAGVYPAIDVVGRVLPGMLERGAGVLLFAGGLSAVRPMPALGALAVSSAALRNYVLTLNAGLAGTGVYAGTLTIGGLVARGDIYHLVRENADTFGDLAANALDPDAIADLAWDLSIKRDRPEEVVTALD